MSYFTAWFMTILVLIGIVFVIIWEMFHGRISLNLVLLLLLVNFGSGVRLALMYISLIVSIRSGLNLTTHDLYFLILAEVFTNCNLAENILHKSYGVNRTQDYGLETWLFGNVIILETLLSTISSIIHFFTKQKFCKYHFLWSQK